MKKKQEVGFLGITKTGQKFKTGDFEMAVLNSSVDPVPVNRKSKKAMEKIVEGMTNAEKQEQLKAYRLQKKKEQAKKRRKATSLQRRKNAYRRRLSKN